MTKTLFICTFVLLVTQYALATGTSVTEVKSEQKKEVTETDKKPLADETKSKDKDYKTQIETGTKIQGDGPFVVNAEQLPKDARDEVMKLLNTQYRLSQEKKVQQQKPQSAGPEFKIEQDESEDDSFDPEWASGIAELLTRMAVEDEDGNQYLDLSELPAELRTEVANYLTKQEQTEQEMAIDDLIQEQIQSEAEENNSKPTMTSPAAVASLFNKHQSSGSQVGGLLGSLIGGAVGGYPAYGSGGHYPGGGYGSYGGYPQYGGGYPQYGGQYGGGQYGGGQYGGGQYGGGQYGGGQHGGYPGGGHHHHHHHGYGYSAYPVVGQSSYGSRHQCPNGRHQCPPTPNGIVVTREQLASLLAADPSLAAHVIPLGTGSMPGYHFQPAVSSFNRQPKPQQPSAQPFNLAANPFASYYYQQLQKAQQNLPSPPAAVKYAQTSRFQPQVFSNKQQPRPLGYYPSNKPAVAPQYRRFNPNQYRF